MNVFLLTNPDHGGEPSPNYDWARSIANLCGGCRMLDYTILDKAFMKRIQTQTPIKNPTRVEYCDQVFKLVNEEADEEPTNLGLIVLTEPWHKDIFRGMIVESRFRNILVVEVLHGGKDSGSKQTSAGGLHSPLSGATGPGEVQPWPL